MVVDDSSDGALRCRARSQTSYCKPQLEHARARHNRLLQQLSELSQQNEQLRQTLQCLESAAEEQLALMVAGQAAFGPTAQRLALAQRQHHHQLEALPPADQWTRECMSHWTGEQIRFLIFHAYKRGGVLFMESLHDASLLPKLSQWVQKTAAFSAYHSLHNCETYHRVRGGNLLTGEPCSAPDGWYRRVAGSLPLHLLPASLRARLHAGLVEFNSALADTQCRLSSMYRQLSRLLPQSVDIDKLCKQACAHPSRPPVTTSSKQQQPAGGNVREQVVLSVSQEELQEVLDWLDSLDQPSDPAAAAAAAAAGGANNSNSDSITASRSMGGSHSAPVIGDGQHEGPDGQAPSSGEGSSVGASYDSIMCQIEQLLEEVRGTVMEQYKASAKMYLKVWGSGDEVHHRVLAHLANASLPYHLDFPLISTALQDRILDAELGAVNAGVSTGAVGLNAFGTRAPMPDPAAPPTPPATAPVGSPPTPALNAVAPYSNTRSTQLQLGAGPGQASPPDSGAAQAAGVMPARASSAPQQVFSDVDGVWSQGQLECRAISASPEDASAVGDFWQQVDCAPARPLPMTGDRAFSDEGPVSRHDHLGEWQDGNAAGGQSVGSGSGHHHGGLTHAPAFLYEGHQHGNSSHADTSLTGGNVPAIHGLQDSASRSAPPQAQPSSSAAQLRAAPGSATALGGRGLWGPRLQATSAQWRPSWGPSIRGTAAPEFEAALLAAQAVKPPWNSVSGATGSARPSWKAPGPAEEW